MKRILSLSAIILAVAILTPGTDAQGQGMITGEVELLLLAYSREDGMRVGTNQNGSEDLVGASPWNASHRTTIGFRRADGLGIRARYFGYEPEIPVGTVVPQKIAVDVTNIDLEIFDTINLDEDWTIELSAGIRSTEFAELLEDQGELRTNSFNGTGGIFAIEARRDVFHFASFYTRARGALLYGTKRRNNFGGGIINRGSGMETYLKTDKAIMELAIGFETNYECRNGTIFFARIGYEFQKWFGFSSTFANRDQQNFDLTGPMPINNASILEEFWDGHSDVGMNGLVISIGFEH